MNVLMIVSDTLRRDHLGAYGNEWIHTPNLNKLASESFVFDNAYTASFPTLPNRCDVMTGRFSFIEYDWSPLPRNKPVLAEAFGQAGFSTMMVADTPHILQNGAHFDRGFMGFEWIRGQENDRWRTFPKDPQLPASADKLRSPEFSVKQYLRNVHKRESELDYFPARTMKAAADWLEENQDESFFLYVDTFDPHEPWDPPAHYLKLYEQDYEGENIIYPQYYEASLYTKTEIAHMRALYAGEVTLVDTWVGYLMQRLEALGLLEDTLVVCTTDHGFCHGEHNLMGKGIIWEGRFANCPLYEEIAHIPLFIRMPNSKHQRRIGGYVQPPDVVRTMCDMAGVQAPETFQGKSLVPLMAGRCDSVRQGAITTPSLAYSPNAGRPTTITLDDWSLIYYGNPDAKLFASLQASVDDIKRPAIIPAGHVPAPQLFKLSEDPGQQHDLYAEYPEIARSIHDYFVRQCEALEMDEEYLQHRRTL